MEKKGSWTWSVTDVKETFDSARLEFDAICARNRILRHDVQASLAELRAEIEEVRDSIRANPLIEEPNAAIRSLSIRERQVLKLIGESHTTKEIAHLLGIAFRTAVNHRTRIMAKLEIHNAAGLTRVAISSPLVSATDVTHEALRKERTSITASAA